MVESGTTGRFHNSVESAQYGRSPIPEQKVEDLTLLRDQEFHRGGLVRPSLHGNGFSVSTPDTGSHLMPLVRTVA
jgi:hypothetical protein